MFFVNMSQLSPPQSTGLLIMDWCLGQEENESQSYLVLQWL